MSEVNLSLEGKVALITGGSKGICRSIARAFAEHGADIAIAARGREALENDPPRNRGDRAPMHRAQRGYVAGGSVGAHRR